MVKRVSVKIGQDILEYLKKSKIHPRETYDDVLRRLLKCQKSTKSE